MLNCSRLKLDILHNRIKHIPLQQITQLKPFLCKLISKLNLNLWLHFHITTGKHKNWTTNYSSSDPHALLLIMFIQNHFNFVNIYISHLSHAQLLKLSTKTNCFIEKRKDQCILLVAHDIYITIWQKFF